jgi:hypothetical protein
MPELWAGRKVVKGLRLNAVLPGRKVALLSAAIAVAGLSLLGVTPASALLGTQPGTLIINPGGTSTTLGVPEPLTTVPTWSTTIACPSTANASAKLLMVNSDGVTLTAWSANINGASTPLTNKTVIASTSVGVFETLGGYSAGQTAELVVQCYTGASGTGTAVPYEDAFITFNTDNATYAIGAVFPGPVTPTVTLTATPNPVQVGISVTLTATITWNNTPVTSGSVQFESNGTAIGAPVAVNSSGVATTTTTFTGTGGTLALTAAFQTGNVAFTKATSNTVSETVTNPLAGGELITVTVPPSGSFAFSGPANATVALTQSGLTATGTMMPVTVTDNRTGLAPQNPPASLASGYNGFPGWSVVGQATDFTDPASQPAGDIPAADFNWTPTNPASGDFALGAPTTAGLGTAQFLAGAAQGHGSGTFGLGANLSLNIPASAPAGAYSSTLTLTANPTANF